MDMSNVCANLIGSEWLHYVSLAARC